ncbi:MAG: NAD(P)/FAD-dependent oxidoreductase [Lachnospiraceae bacterium]|nr:NAD(P)/FAD-dependent oxidoreductase [Lachnospiraceae bacterium]
MKEVLIVGGGAAGMMAAVTAAREGCAVRLFERNEKLGKKIYITGKGRCNLTNACETEEFLGNVVSNPRFLYRALYGFSNRDTADFFEKAGLALKTERGNRVFPVSDKASDVIKALTREMEKAGVRVCLNSRVTGLLAEEGRVFGIRLADGREIPGDAVLIATGGLSYPSTGSQGDGFLLAESVGHAVTDCSPALVPFETGEEWAKELQGLSLRNVEVTIFDGKKKLYREFGEMLFTHFGVSGPAVLSGSSRAAKAIRKHPLTLEINFKPALTREQLDARLLREFEANKNKYFKNALGALLPARMVPVMADFCEIGLKREINGISREERGRLADGLRHFQMTLTGLRGYPEAIVTQGGVCVKEVDPATMASKKVQGLYFAGEVLDVDAYTGGYNLQIAWSTGRAAGQGIASS